MSEYRNLAHEFVTKRKTYQGDTSDEEARVEYTEVLKRWDGKEGHAFAVQHVAELETMGQEAPQWIRDRAHRHPPFYPWPSPRPCRPITDAPNAKVARAGERAVDGGEKGTLEDCPACDGHGSIDTPELGNPGKSEPCTYCHGDGLLFRPDAQARYVEPTEPTKPLDEMMKWLSDPRNQAVHVLPPDPQQEFFAALMQNRVTVWPTDEGRGYRIHVDPRS